MEEQKVAGKEVKMNVGTTPKGNAPASEKSIVEELQTWTKDKLVQQVIQMNQQLYSQDSYINKLRNQINEMNQFISHKRLEYLFKVVEISSKENQEAVSSFFADDFVRDCINEIQESLTIPQEQEPAKEEK